MKYVCPCGYVYDEALGDPENGIEAGTPWSMVPEDFLCPVCGLEKSAFEKEQHIKKREGKSLPVFLYSFMIFYS